MFTTIAMQTLPSGEVIATAPDLAGCLITDSDASAGLARIRLAVEGTLANLLLSGQPLPERRSLAAWQAEPRFHDTRWFEIHINLEQIEAVARHQRGRPHIGSSDRHSAASGPDADGPHGGTARQARGKP